MLAEKKLEKKFWAEAANTAVYLINRTGTSPIAEKTPYELWHKKSFDLHLLKGMFGQEVWVHIPKEKRQKLDMKSKCGIFVGYSENVKGHRAYFKDENVVTIEREIIFAPEPVHEDTVEKEEITVSLDLDNAQENENKDEVINNTPVPENESVVLQILAENIPPEERLRPRNTLKPPTRFDDYAVSYFSVDVDEPTSYEEAMNGEHASEWQQAIDEELKALNDNGTWQIVDKPEKCDIVDSKWVFKVKKDEESRINKFKCRLVAKGFQQKNV